MDCALRRHDSAGCGVPVGLALVAPAGRFIITDSPWPTPFERVPTSPGRASGRLHEQRCLPPRITACGSPWPTPQKHVPTSPGRSQWPTPCNWVPTSPDHGLLPCVPPHIRLAVAVGCALPLLGSCDEGPLHFRPSFAIFGRSPLLRLGLPRVGSALPRPAFPLREFPRS